MKTFNDILEQLGCDSSDSFYELMAEHWSDGLDAILTYNPKNGKVNIGSIYSNESIVTPDNFSQEKWIDFFYSKSKYFREDNKLNKDYTDSNFIEINKINTAKNRW